MGETIPRPFNSISTRFPPFVPPSTSLSRTMSSNHSSQLIQDWDSFIREPVKQVDQFLRKNNAQSDSLLQLHGRIGDALTAVPHHHRELIPSFNDATRLADKSLVRFTCMVQDMFDPEFYLALFETENKQSGEKGTGYGMFRDSVTDSDRLDVNYDCPSNVMQDRMTYLCIDVPGLNDWTREKSDSLPVKEEPMDTSVPTTDPVEGSSSQSVSSGDSNDVKRFKPDQETAAKIRTSLSQCFPSIDSRAKKLAFIKMYDTRDLALKLNDVIEVIGIMDIGDRGGDIAQEKNQEAGATGDTIDLDANNFSLPSVVAPHIHALSVKKLSHLNPLPPAHGSASDLPASSEPASASGNSHVDQGFCERMRKELHAIMSLCLFGDELAAEYLVLCLISRIYARQEMMSLGSLSVGFSNLPRTTQPEIREYMKSLYELMSDLVTHSVYLPLSLETLNGRSFVPRKDHSCNKLVSGQLQLPAETLLFVDETALEAGKLGEQGLVNLKSLGELIKWQQLKYDFEYHAIDVNTDMKIVVFSEGKSLLPLNFRIPLEVPKDAKTDRLMQTVREYLNPQLLQQIRQYMTAVREAEYQIPADVQKQIQDDFVEMRQMDSKKVTADTLHQLLTLARLMAISRGEGQLSLQTWDNVMRMEAARQGRQSAP